MSRYHLLLHTAKEISANRNLGVYYMRQKQGSAQRKLKPLFDEINYLADTSNNFD